MPVLLLLRVLLVVLPGLVVLLWILVARWLLDATTALAYEATLTNRRFGLDVAGTPDSGRARGITWWRWTGRCTAASFAPARFGRQRWFREAPVDPSVIDARQPVSVRPDQRLGGDEEDIAPVRTGVEEARPPIALPLEIRLMVPALYS